MLRAKSEGFTLIELLIVVAIIAILAAIAIPNFLEAQVRSRVSRVVADMRALATTLDLYNVDNGTYPRLRCSPCGCTEIAFCDHSMISPGRREYAGILVTTPIAYITQVPPDVFNTVVRGNVWPCPVGSLCSVVWSINPAGNDPDWMTDGTMGAHYPRTFRYLLESAGPDCTWWQGSAIGSDNAGHHDRLWYDPTNGTVSQGQISLTDRGFLPINKLH